MNLRRLLRTSAIHLALRYALLYALLIGAALAFLYWSNNQFITDQIINSLEQELDDLKHLEQDQGIIGLQHAIQLFSHESKGHGQFFLLLSATGDRLAGVLKKWPREIKLDEKVHYIYGEIYSEYDHDMWPMIATTLPGGERLLVGDNITKLEEVQEYSITVMLLIFCISVILALMMGLFLARTVLSRIDTINATTATIANGSFDSRIPVSERNDEFDELTRHLNYMFARIEKLMSGMRQVTDNVAHDLRQPLSRLRNRLEVTLLEPRKKSEYQDEINQAIKDVDNLMRTFNSLLEIAKAESYSNRGKWSTVDLSELGLSLGELYQDQAEEHCLTLSLHIDPKIAIQGNRDLIAQLISNLLENAIKFTASGGNISLYVQYFKQSACLMVADNGPGIPAEQREHVLGRFIRLEGARSTPGNGLGLSLVKAVADLHQAQLQLKDNLPGLRVIILF